MWKRLPFRKAYLITRFSIPLCMYKILENFPITVILPVFLPDGLHMNAIYTYLVQYTLQSSFQELNFTNCSLLNKVIPGRQITRKSPMLKDFNDFYPFLRLRWTQYFKRLKSIHTLVSKYLFIVQFQGEKGNVDERKHLCSLTPEPSNRRQSTLYFFHFKPIYGPIDKSSQFEFVIFPFTRRSCRQGNSMAESRWNDQTIQVEFYMCSKPSK